jgi:hypothetical protein
VFPSDQIADKRVERRREEKAEAGHPKHPEQYRRPKGSPHFGARAGRNRQWRHAQDEREGRHQDRTKSGACRMHYALKRSSTLVFPLARKFDNQNRVFRG